MTTTLTPGTLVVTISETVTLNGQEANSQNTLTLSNNIAEAYKRILTVPTAGEITLYTTHDTDVAGAQLDDDLIKYARITNKDDTNYVSVRVTDANDDEFVYKLNAGESFLLHSHDTSMSACDTATAGAANANIVSVKAQANSGACDCEVFVASI